MSRALYRYDKEKKELIPIEKARKLEVHNVIDDEMEPMLSHASLEKKFFTSKSKYRKHLVEKGFRETGGEHLKQTPNKREIEKREVEECRKDVEQAYFDVKYGRVNFSEAEKEKHLRENRRLGDKWTLKAPY